MVQRVFRQFRYWATVSTAAIIHCFTQHPGPCYTSTRAFGVTENTPPEQSLNLAYEIAYWRYGLDIACEWKEKLGQPVPETWTKVAENLAKPPQIDGLYVVYDGLNASWWDDPALIGDPRSLIMLQGVLPDTPAVDGEIAKRTANKVSEVWTDDKVSGWRIPVLAINSARIGNPEKAIHYLTSYDYWHFDDAGTTMRSSISRGEP